MRGPWSAQPGALLHHLLPNACVEFSLWFTWALRKREPTPLLHVLIAATARCSSYCLRRATSRMPRPRVQQPVVQQPVVQQPSVDRVMADRSDAGSLWLRAGPVASSLLVMGGMAVQQLGLWSLYADLALVCSLGGAAVTLLGACVFECSLPHSAEWMEGKVLTGTKLDRHNVGLVRQGLPELREGARGGETARGSFLFRLAAYSAVALLATLVNVIRCQVDWWGQGTVYSAGPGTGGSVTTGDTNLDWSERGGLGGCGGWYFFIAAASVLHAAPVLYSLIEELDRPRSEAAESAAVLHVGSHGDP